MSEEKIHEEYFRLTREYQLKYGKKVALLMQVGAFFEIYGKKIALTGQIVYSEIVDICYVCGGLTIADKKVGFEDGQIVMAGVRDYNLDKYLPKLVDAGYTAIVYVQEKNGKQIVRKLYSIYSAGTFLPADIDSAPQITNNIMCIWLQTYTPFINTTKMALNTRLVCGIAVANIFTGQSFLYEYETEFSMQPTTFDELERCISVYQPSEIICIGPFDTTSFKKILDYSGVKTNNVHYHDTRELDQKSAVIHASQPKYIRHLLSTHYTEESDVYESCREFHEYVLATQSFVYLLHFIQEHNPNLVKNILKPIFHNVSKRMLLANHSLRQLNIIDDGNNQSVYSSVSSFLNKCCSPLGKRRFYSQITNPVFDQTWLQTEYDMIEFMMTPTMYPMIDMFRKILREICDLEKMGRLLNMRKITADSLYRLYTSVLKIQQLHLCLFESPELCRYLASDICDDDVHAWLENRIVGILKPISETFMIEECAGLTSVDRNIIRQGQNAELDQMVAQYEKSMQLFYQIKDGLNRIVVSQSNNQDNEYIKIHETEKLGMSLQITKVRSALLKKGLKDTKSTTILFGGNIVQTSDIHFKTASGSTEEIEFTLLSETLHKIRQLKESIDTKVNQLYQMFLESFERNSFSDIKHLSEYIAKLDLIQCKTYIAYTYNYCKPVIDTESENSYIKTTGIRHALIEHIQQNETYVANDVCLSEDTHTGILLYGTNAVGKTSLIRAVGISIIMAQSGMYVPASTMKYSPYKSIFTRILGNDNLFKNLSTFAVEMSELRVILNHADQYSLVLGDELCSGTETESALSIFTAGLCHLDIKKTSFIFATHFHEIVRFDELQSLQNIALKHMSVIYDRETDTLIYDRLLKDGPGNKMYGLEVAKSMHLPLEFIEKAYTIRTKYFPDGKGELSTTPASRYNSNKIKSMCENCKANPAIETHHLLEQQDADEKGYIGNVHKNHTANLMALCESCHQKMHEQSNTSPKRKVKTTKGYKVVK